MKNNYIKNEGSDLTNETDDVLLDYVALQDEFPEEARTAFTVFYNKYFKMLYHILFKICKAFKKNSDEAADIVSMTFAKIWIKKLRIDKANLKIENYTLKWLVRISKNIFFDMNRKSKVDISYTDDANELDSIISRRLVFRSAFYDNQKTSGTEKSNEELIHEYLLSIKERDFDIIIQYYDEYVPEQNIPETVLDKIALRNKTTKDNIHQIISRTRRKIREILKSQIKIRA